MTRIGIRQLRQNASAYLRLVKAGESVQIVDRGRPVALWIPIPTGGAVARLELESRLGGAHGDLLDLGPPLRATRGTSSASETLARDRER